MSSSFVMVIDEPVAFWRMISEESAFCCVAEVEPLNEVSVRSPPVHSMFDPLPVAQIVGVSTPVTSG